MKKQLGTRLPIVVEIVGPAGSGKSAVVRWLLESDPSMRNVPLSGVHDLPRLARGAVGCAPAVAGALLSDPRFALRNVRHLLRIETLRARLARIEHDRPQVALFDEGPIYSLARLHAFCPPQLERRRFGEHLRRSARRWALDLDLVIMLDAPNAVLSDRIRSRAKPHRMRYALNETLFGFLNSYRSAYAKVAADLARTGDTTVVAIDTATLPVSSIGKRVLDVIRAEAEGAERVIAVTEPAPADDRRHAVAGR